MKRFYFFVCIILYTLPVYSLSSFSANYNLIAKTNLGSIQLGSAEYELKIANNIYVFNNNAATDFLWRKIYDFSVEEISIGLLIDDKLNSNYYEIKENIGESSDIFEINIYPDKHVVSLNNQLNWKAKSRNIVDALSIYLHLSMDVQKNPNKTFFTYELVDKKGLNDRDFKVIGNEVLLINDIETDTIRIECQELRLVLNLSKAHNYIPVKIQKTNGQTQYKLLLNELNER